MLVLASSSPRRVDLLREWGYQFELVKPVVSEDFPENELPEVVVQDLAKRKALAGFELWKIKGSPGDIILGADTIVVLDKRIFGKPADAEDAREMLKDLSGKTHRVMTAIALAGMDADYGQLGMDVSLDITTVSFKEISDREIRDYISTGEPMDKAAAYGIQGEAGKFVVWIEGSLTNVIGLPMELLAEKLQDKNIYPRA